MAKITIRRPVFVTAIMTPDLRNELAQELQAAADEVDRRNDQLEFEAKRILGQNRDLQQAMAIRQRVEQEKQRQQALKDEILKRRDEVLALEDGAEVLRDTVEGLVEVGEGDHLDEILAGAEIVVKDGVVTEVRERRQEAAERVDLSAAEPRRVIRPDQTNE